MYAEALGVDPALEILAQWIQWADSARQAHDWANTQYNLQQFYAAKDGLDSETTNTFMNDIVFLDATSHRILGYMYMGQLATADKSQLAQLGQAIKDQFSASSQEFAAAGYETQSQDDALHAGQGTQWAAQSAAAYIDDSYMTAVKDTVNKDLDAAGNIISAAGSALDLLKSPLAWIAGGALVLVLLVKR